MTRRLSPRAVQALSDELLADMDELRIEMRWAYPIGIASTHADAVPAEPDWDAWRRVATLQEKIAKKRAAVDEWSSTCGICGAVVFPEWAEITTYGDRQPRYVQGSYDCPTPRCGEVCKICRREIGDVHGPDCGPLMFVKIERPHIIDRGDCT